MDKEIKMTNAQVIEILQDFIFGNFDISREVRFAIDAAIYSVQKLEEYHSKWGDNIEGFIFYTKEKHS